MGTDIRTFLAHRLGDRALRARRTYSFELPRQGGREAVFDPYNRRIKLYGVGPVEYEAGCAEMITGAGADPGVCSKVAVYALPGDDLEWEELGLAREGVIQGFFAGGVDAVIWAGYSDPKRARPSDKGEIERIIRAARKKAPANPAFPAGYACQVATAREAPEIGALLRETFEDYPTPVDDATVERLIKTGASRFRIVRAPDGKVAAVASAEIDGRRSSAEMTDCATAPAHRGKGLMAALLAELARDLTLSVGITDVYSLCRAGEPGINCVLGKLGYTYTGTLVNNCKMPDGWESMNVWCKALKGEKPVVR